MQYRDVFNIENKLHVGYLKHVRQSILDGTSKWSAKIKTKGKGESAYSLSSK